jgi:hypothetical protein
MLHKIVLPFEPEKLAGVFALQVQLLQLACLVDRIDQAAIEAFFDDPQIVAWIMSSRQRTVGCLHEFAETCPSDIKWEILEELQSDYGFWEHRDDPAFVFRFQAQEPHRELIVRWLKGYFRQFGRGIDGIITRSRFINKGIWVDAFRAVNPDVRTCPVCDSSMQSGITVEHFLPQEHYPVLCVHVANLIPTCEHCNAREKENKDPLEQAGLTELFLPYHRHAMEFCDVRVIRGSEGSYEFSLVPRDDSPDIGKALNEMSRLFDVPGRWTRNAQHVVDVASAKIREQLYADLDDGKSVGSEADFEVMLEKLCRRIQHQCGLQSYFVPASGWLRWARENFVPQLWKAFRAQAQVAAKQPSRAGG